jgi:hypothetical protein
MEELIAYRQELFSALESVVDELSKKVTHTHSRAWHHSSGSGGRTAHYSLTHLREIEAQVFSIQLHRILEEETPLMPPFDDEAWMANHYKREEPAAMVLEGFTILRKQELPWLRDLPPVSWSRIARHPRWGVHAFQWWVEKQLDCSKQHLWQISTLLAM